MKLLTYPGEFRHRKLYDELRAAITGELSLSGQTDILTDPATSATTPGVIVGVADGTDSKTVDQVVAAHDPTTPGPTEAAEAAAAANDQTLRDRLAATLATLEQANTGWTTLTAAQKDSALRAAVRANAGLIRLRLGRLDTTG